MNMKSFPEKQRNQINIGKRRLVYEKNIQKQLGSPNLNESNTKLEVGTKNVPEK